MGNQLQLDDPGPLNVLIARLVGRAELVSLVVAIDHLSNRMLVIRGHGDVATILGASSCQGVL